MYVLSESTANKIRDLIGDSGVGVGNVSSGSAHRQVAYVKCVTWDTGTHEGTGQVEQRDASGWESFGDSTKMLLLAHDGGDLEEDARYLAVRFGVSGSGSSAKDIFVAVAPPVSLPPGCGLHVHVDEEDVSTLAVDLEAIAGCGLAVEPGETEEDCDKLKVDTEPDPEQETTASLVTSHTLSASGCSVALSTTTQTVTVKKNACGLVVDVVFGTPTTSTQTVTTDPNECIEWGEICVYCEGYGEYGGGDPVTPGYCWDADTRLWVVCEEAPPLGSGGWAFACTGEGWNAGSASDSPTCANPGTPPYVCDAENMGASAYYDCATSTWSYAPPP